ncbi:MAG TPA: proton-conducting transporter membrane subunit [bacterium]|nr:proton-conducting transporter membrane subunit [bacterium]
MNPELVLLLAVPAACGVAILAIPQRARLTNEILFVGGALANLILAIALFRERATFALPWLGYGIDFAVRLDSFSTFILLAASSLSFLVALYSSAFMREKTVAKQFFAYLLISLSMVNGATIADNLVMLLFFWEGLLVTLYGFIAIGGKDAFKTAVKALVIVGLSDLAMMLGIGLTAHLAGTLTMSGIALPTAGLANLAFILMMVGAISKGGSMPFHSWIPDAAIAAPTPFMAFMPAALEKLLGIYLLGRISMQMFALRPESALSTLLMIVGGLTILLAVMMALVQKDYKRLLSYHAISQVGYMILGLGTAVPVGIVGGLFHMVNNALYKCCLFLTGGAVEKQAGTTDLKKLGGLKANMPVTFACFAITALAISGVPPFNGFFSKELVYDGALERGVIFYLMAVVGSFFTAASFLKLGHSAFLGKRSSENDKVKEAPAVMLVPMIVIAAICILFGLYNQLPIRHLIEPVLGPEKLEGHSFAGLPKNWMLVGVTVVVLVGALANHLLGARRAGSGLGAVDHVHYAPGLATIYDRAERRWFDPYDLGLKVVGVLAKALWGIDRIIDWIYDGFTVTLTTGLGRLISWLHNGNFATYLIWALGGAVLVVIYAIAR